MILPIFVSIAHDACEVSALFRHVLAACAGLCFTHDRAPPGLRDARAHADAASGGGGLADPSALRVTLAAHANEGEIAGHGISDLLA